jgi:hypothetical protein
VLTSSGSSARSRTLPPGTLVNAILESSSYRPVLEELGAQCIPRISRLMGFFDRFISLLPGSLFKECLLDIDLGGMHFVKCLGDGLHVFWRHCGFGHGPNRRPFKVTRRPLSAFPDPVGNRLRSGRQNLSCKLIDQMRAISRQVLLNSRAHVEQEEIEEYHPKCSLSSRHPPICSNLCYTQKQSEHCEKSIREAQNSG